jgi:hypothetical protein
MKKYKTKLRQLGHRQYLVPLLFIGGLAISGSLLLVIGFAATPDNPIGFADSCQLDGTTTIVRGWAHDDSAGSGPDPAVQVTVAGKTATAPTSIANYRQAEIDIAIASLGYTPASIYGFEIRFTGLYKGTNPVINGTIFNVGPGANVPLEINTFNQGAASSGTAIFLNGNVVPDSCLASSPGPAPITPKSTPTVKKQTVSPVKPINPTPPATPSPQAQTNYVVTLSFFNNTTEVTDVKATLAELNVTATTDKNNQVTFQDVPPGTYTANFSNQGKDYSYTLEVPASQPGQSTASADGKTLSYTIDLASLLAATQAKQTTNTQPPAKGKGQIGRIIILFTGFMLILAILVAAIIFGRRRYRSRKNSRPDDALSRPPAAPPTNTPPSSHAPPPGDASLHAGVSLKQMVIESMRKEAANREHNDRPKQ